MDNTSHQNEINPELVEHILAEYKETLEALTKRFDSLDERYALKLELDKAVDHHDSKFAMIENNMQRIKSDVAELNAKLTRRIVGTGLMVAIVSSIITGLLTHIVEGLI